MLYPIIFNCLVVFVVSFSIDSLILITYRWHKNITQDSNLGKQKYHLTLAPRVGGIAILLSAFVGFGLMMKTEPNIIKWLSFSALIVFLGGLTEDLSKKVPPKYRLILAFIAAIVAIYGLDIFFMRTGWEYFDQIFLVPLVSLAVTIFMIGGVTHSTNIIDGFNGLMLGFALMVLAIFCWVSIQVNDFFLLQVFLITISAILGLFLFNFPKGKILTGDGGAYLIGFLLAVYSLLLINRNNSVSPWLPLLLLCYPVFETLFSMYRRKIIKNISPSEADGMHLHTLIFRRFIPQVFKPPKNTWHKNGLTSMLLWVLVLPFILPSLWLWGHSLTMIIAMMVFCVAYAVFYFRIVRFKISAN